MNSIETGKTTWDLLPMLSGDDDPTIEQKIKKMQKAHEKFVNNWKDRTDYLEDAKVLGEAMGEYENLVADYGTLGDVGYYFGLRSSQDQGCPKIKAKLNKIRDFNIKLWNNLQFFEHRIAKIPEDKQVSLLAYPDLAEYKHLLEGLFEYAKYLLSEPEERILNLEAATSYGNWVRMVTDFISREEREVFNKEGKLEKKAFSEILKLMDEKDKKIRDKAAGALNEILEKHVNVAEAELNSVLKYKRVQDELRGMERPDLNKHIADDIDSEIVDVLLESVSSRFDISKRYYELKAKLLAVPKLEYHERNVSYGDIPDKYSYQDSVELLNKVFESLDSEFSKIFRNFVENGNIDVFPRKGKIAGAYCSYGLIVHPVYVLLNHTDKFQDVTTFAHEMGHAINNELMKKKQNSLNFGTPTCTAEVASTFFEDFVLDEIAGEADEETRLAIMMMRLNDAVSSITRQVACYKFEQDLHKDFREKGYLSKSEIGELFQKHMSAYMGDFVEQSEGSKNWWVYWGHIRSFFYVYSYASGLLISKSLQKAVKEDPKFVAKVKDFLSAGLSDSPKNIFAKLGVDITDRGFWERGLDELDDLLNETEKLAEKLGKV